MKKKLLTLLVGCVILTGVAGCSSKKSSEGNTKKPSVTTTPTDDNKNSGKSSVTTAPSSEDSKGSGLNLDKSNKSEINDDEKAEE